MVPHGEQDPVLRVSAGRATARAVGGARLVTYPGVGHDLPAAVWPGISRRISDMTAHQSPSGGAGVFGQPLEE
ncbi:hypothetical protein [Streptomyces sp. NPDC088744]|uniref:alpha/beta fold hydrolase n=1 Tax=Streptomyces sp. NPDC088744 TaxID=3155061 RepID=UPI00344DB484